MLYVAKLVAYNALNLVPVEFLRDLHEQPAWLFSPFRRKRKRWGVSSGTMASLGMGNPAFSASSFTVSSSRGFFALLQISKPREAGHNRWAYEVLDEYKEDYA